MRISARMRGRVSCRLGGRCEAPLIGRLQAHARWRLRNWHLRVENSFLSGIGRELSALHALLGKLKCRSLSLQRLVLRSKVHRTMASEKFRPPIFRSRGW